MKIGFKIKLFGAVLFALCIIGPMPANGEFQENETTKAGENVWVDPESGVTFEFVGVHREVGDTNRACVKRLGEGWLLPQRHDDMEMYGRLFKSPLRTKLLHPYMQRPTYAVLAFDDIEELEVIPRILQELSDDPVPHIEPVRISPCWVSPGNRDQCYNPVVCLKYP